MQDKYQGIGISFKFKGDTVLVKSVIPGSGADNMGIKEGDKIVKIGDRGIEDFYSYLDITRVLTGETNSTLTVALADGDSLQVKDIVRNAVTVILIPFWGIKEILLPLMNMRKH